MNLNTVSPYLLVQSATTIHILGVTGFLSVTRIAKTDKKLFSNYGLHTTKTVSCKVSDGVGVVQYGMQPGRGFKPRRPAV